MNFQLQLTYGLQGPSWPTSCSPHVGCMVVKVLKQQSQQGGRSRNRLQSPQPIPTTSTTAPFLAAFQGHVDPGEDEWVAALRETKEEAGILQEQLKIYEDCHETLRYEVKGKPKTVKYWLALLKNPDDVKLSHEHQLWKWAELDEAIKIAEYAEMGALLRKFKAYVDNLKS